MGVFPHRPERLLEGIPVNLLVNSVQFIPRVHKALPALRNTDEAYINLSEEPNPPVDFNHNKSPLTYK